MRKCQVCRQAEADWTWQPLGPGDSPQATFTAPGWHYRGFPTIATCDGCKRKVENGEEVHYTYKKVEYIANQAQA